MFIVRNFVVVYTVNRMGVNRDPQNLGTRCRPAYLGWGRGRSNRNTPLPTCVTMQNTVVLGQMARTEIRLRNWPLAFRLSRSLKVIGTDKDRSDTCDFLLLFRSNPGPVQYRFQHMATCICRKLPSPPLRVPLAQWTGMLVYQAEKKVGWCFGPFRYKNKTRLWQTDRQTDIGHGYCRALRSVAR